MAMRMLSGALGACGGYFLGKHIVKKLDSHQWERASHSGNPVSLTGGFTTVSALSTGLLATLPKRTSMSALVISSSGALAGWIDDHLEDKFPARGKGFKGHLGALKEGKVTSGLLKIGTIGAGAVFAAGIGQIKGSTCRCKPLVVTPVPKHLKKRNLLLKRLAHIGVDSLILAGSANFLNLLDLRPGRALKFAGLCAVPALLISDDARSTSGVILTTAIANLPSDLAGETMLGDMGANALGGVVGTLVTSSQSMPVKLLVLGTITGLTAASEKVSFSKVIAENKILSVIDDLGRK
ncbi:hypothetical protein [Arcanobacterium bovis]|uniref:Uncharacterized protein n=1 Tax=Arcanobacterium bovis TaxID=2529275 RepID=A0A4Q9V1M6_9ACTO|nr:hypothetical protein [Arcanobacterium bovis]TBW23014.1 hypothetical protein EZJ44_03760 [Arcanobacterium bovis]